VLTGTQRLYSLMGFRLSNSVMETVLGQITRAGCMIGSCIASYCAAAAQMDRHNNEGQLFRGDMLTAYICFIY